MSEGDQPVSATAAQRQAVDEDDHDLLTFTEAGERLRVEIAAAKAEAERLKSAGDPVELEKVERRLAALQAAAERNSAQLLNDANFEKFFGYPGKARRSRPGSSSHRKS